MTALKANQNMIKVHVDHCVGAEHLGPNSLPCIHGVLAVNV